MFFDLFHRHYWGPPRRREGTVGHYMTCYECGKRRKLKIDIEEAPIAKQEKVMAQTEKGVKAA